MLQCCQWYWNQYCEHTYLHNSSECKVFSWVSYSPLLTCHPADDLCTESWRRGGAVLYRPYTRVTLPIIFHLTANTHSMKSCFVRIFVRDRRAFLSSLILASWMCQLAPQWRMLWLIFVSYLIPYSLQSWQLIIYPKGHCNVCCRFICYWCLIIYVAMQ